MSQHRTLFAVATFLLALGLSGVASAAKKGALDGKTFTINMTDPQKKSGSDTLTFAGGQFISDGCKQYGFGNAPYSATKTKDGWSFSVTAASKKEGVNRWSGTVKADGTISGQLVWSKTGQKDIHYTFSGSLKK